MAMKSASMMNPMAVGAAVGRDSLSSTAAIIQKRFRAKLSSRLQKLQQPQLQQQQQQQQAEAQQQPWMWVRCITTVFFVSGVCLYFWLDHFGGLDFGQALWSSPQLVLLSAAANSSARSHVNVTAGGDLTSAAAGQLKEALLAVGETVTLLTPPSPSLLEHLLHGGGGCSRMTVPPAAARCRVVP